VTAVTSRFLLRAGLPLVPEQVPWDLHPFF